MSHPCRKAHQADDRHRRELVLERIQKAVDWGLPREDWTGYILFVAGSTPRLGPQAVLAWKSLSPEERESFKKSAVQLKELWLAMPEEP